MEGQDFILPGNENNLQSMIDATFIDKTSPQGYVPTGYEKSLMDAYATTMSPNQIGQQGMGSLYPGLGEDINVGTYSGSIVGNNPIFVPTGNITAIDPILQRKKAIDDAARKRALSAMEKPIAPDLKKFKDSRFDEKLNNDILSFHSQMVKDAYDNYGPSYTQMLKDPNTELGRKYVQGMANFEHIVRNTDRITESVATIEKGMQDGSIAVTPEGMKTFNQYKQMLGDFTDYEKLSSADMSQIENKLLGIVDINNYLNKSGVLSGIKAKVTSTYGTIDKGEYYNSVTNKRTSSKEVVRDLSKSLANSSAFRYGIENGYYTQEDIEAALGARLKDQQEVTGSMSQKTEFSYGAGMAEQINAWDVSNNQYSKGNEKSLEAPLYDKSGKIKENKVPLRAMADYNITLTSPKEYTVNERNAKGEIVSKKVRGIPLDGVEIIGEGGSTVKVPGKTYANLGTVRTIEDPKNPGKYMVVQEADLEVPTKSASITKDDVTVGGEDTYTTQKSYVILSRNGQGTGTRTKIENNITDAKKKKNFQNGFKELEKIGSSRVGTQRDPLGIL